MKVSIPLLSALETALNTWLSLDAESFHKCENLTGKIIRLHITGLELNLFFLPSVSGIQVMGNYPDHALNTKDTIDSELTDDNAVIEDGASSFSGEVDTTIHGSPMSLIRLGAADDASTSLLEGDVNIDGDMRVAEHFSAILKEVDIDWEELLSKFVGDIIAHQTGQFVQNSSNWFKDSTEAMALNTSEYLSEEIKVTPADAELAEYVNQVDEVSMAVERLAARVKQLKDSLNPKVDD